MNPAAAWMQRPATARKVDMSWMSQGSGDIRPMFVDRPEPEPLKPPPPPPQAPPPPTGPSKEQLKEIADSTEIIGLLAHSLETLADATHKEVGKMAEEILEIALAVAEELAAGAIEAEPNRIITLIHSALEMVGVDQNVKVHLHPKVHERLKTQGLLENLSARGGITLIPDPKITDVGCIVESPMGRVDARVRSRLNQLRHLFAQKMGVEP